MTDMMAQNKMSQTIPRVLRNCFGKTFANPTMGKFCRSRLLRKLLLDMYLKWPPPEKMPRFSKKIALSKKFQHLTQIPRNSGEGVFKLNEGWVSRLTMPPSWSMATKMGVSFVKNWINDCFIPWIQYEARIELMIVSYCFNCYSK